MSVIGYTYCADEYCEDCIVRVVEIKDECDVVTQLVGAEPVLDALAIERGIDREDEASFDSDDFPKVIGSWHGDMEGRCCGRCGEEL